MKSTNFKSGKVIILNGTSSSGKSTLAKLIQSMSAIDYLHMSLDAFWNMTPSHIPANSINFPKIKLAMVKSVKGLIDTGHYVVVDSIFSGEKTQQEFLSELSSFDLCFIKVECPLVELIRREKERGNRKIGLAESQLLTTHDKVNYDFVIDTSAGDVKQQVETILNSFVSEQT